ncbi:MAG TPA: amidohydrolase family protein [archaeon]|nr:amidohydrolase family protein [archaeon]
MRSKIPSFLSCGRILSLFALTGLALGSFGYSGTQPAPNEQGQRMTVEELEKMPKIDAHAHIMEFGDTGEELFAAALARHNMKWLDICTFELNGDDLQKQIGLAEKFHTLYPERLSWATTFTLDNWGDRDWLKNTIEVIEDGFARGAVAVKVWKDIGMVLKDPDSSFVMIDDARFDPVFDYIEASGKTLIGHIGEPRSCWLPLDSMTTDGDRAYYRKNPQYHGYLLPDIPGYWEQVNSRDRMLEKHPGLRFVGCHLGSLEYDVDVLAKRLDKYPNFAVDMAGRICHFQVQDREKVRNFILNYQDRLLYGTDNLVGWTSSSLEEQLERFDRVYRQDYRYFATGDELEVPEVREGFLARGLDLPASVLKKIYYENALRWYPGI